MAARGHFLASRGCFFGSSSSSGDILSISCAIWDAALASAPPECGQWTMPSFQDLQTWEPASHSPVPISLLFPALRATPGEKGLAFAWHGHNLVSSPLLSKQTSFIPMLKGNKWKRSPSSHQAPAKTCSRIRTWVLSSVCRVSPCCPETRQWSPDANGCCWGPTVLVGP